ncbi:hypothetical protein F2P81_011789 [Scophthalmus maximus]|uniref:ATP synthase subunit epsilon mitochondrial n=1 Tax=Scophthalmus maximus TaxID=52904 RepID=A0A6A4SSQ0_SCOMX|nr:hypothetical protein F2P81_011789 [Scophthalmus maximus]
MTNDVITLVPDLSLKPQQRQDGRILETGRPKHAANMCVCVCPLCSYIRFSAICASAVRAALKPQFRAEALKAAEANVKVAKPKAAA